MKKLLPLFILVLILPALQGKAQCSGFYDGFESGTFASPWAMGTGVYTMTVPTTSPAVGTYNLNMSCSTTNSFYQGPIATFTSGQPGYISWRARTNTTNGANGYFVVGDANVGSDNGILFSYFNSTSGLRFFNTAGYNHTISANTWYKVECYLNWTSRTMDIYVDNVLILSNWAFRSTTCMAVDRVLMHSLVAASVDYDEIIIGNPPVTATSVQTNISCFGGTNGSATVTASGGNGSYTYSWAPSGGTAATASGLAAGTYTCTITDGGGCSATSSVTITEPTVLTISASQTDVTCNGSANGTATVSASGGMPGYTYSWAPSGGTGAAAIGLSGGTYTCTITDANGCSTTNSVSITEPQLLQSASVGFSTSCASSADGSALVTVMGGTFPYTYSWAPSGGTSSLETGLSAGTYTCTMTDANGCTTVQTVTITSPPALSIAVSGNNTICAGSSTTLSVSSSGGTGSASFNWQPGNTGGNTVTVSPSGTTSYYVTATDSNGCSATDSMTVSVISNPVVNLGSDISQCGGSVTLDAQNSGSAYSWSSGGSSQTETISSSGPVSVTVTDGSGCSSADTILVTINTPPVVAFSGDITQCGGTVTLDAQNSGASYMWSDSSTAQTLTVSSSGTYYVTVTDGNGCTGSDTVNVTINTMPVVVGSASSNFVCTDDANVTLFGSPAGGTWSGPGVSGSSFDPSAGTGNMSLIYAYTDPNGCAGNDTVTITVNACTGIADNGTGNELLVYPNPNNGSFSLRLAKPAEDLQIEVVDASGRLVYRSEEKNTPAVFNKTIAVDEISDGFYLLRVIANGSQQVVRLSVQR